MNGQIAISTMLRVHAGLNGHPAKTESTDPPARSLREISLHLREKVDAFLAEEPDTPVLRSVQEHLRVSMAVVDEALQKHPCVHSLRAVSIL